MHAPFLCFAASTYFVTLASLTSAQDIRAVLLNIVSLGASTSSALPSQLPVLRRAYMVSLAYFTIRVFISPLGDSTPYATPYLKKELKEELPKAKERGKAYIK